jgi:hypothetical protein
MCVAKTNLCFWGIKYELVCFPQNKIQKKSPQSPGIFEKCQGAAGAEQPAKLLLFA